MQYREGTSSYPIRTIYEDFPGKAKKTIGIRIRYVINKSCFMNVVSLVTLKYLKMVNTL